MGSGFPEEDSDFGVPFPFVQIHECELGLGEPEVPGFYLAM